MDSQASPAAASDTTLPPAWAGMSPDEAHTTATEDLGAEAKGTDVQMEVRTVVKQICPDCGEAFMTMEEAKTHWLKVHQQQQQQQQDEQEQQMFTSTAFDPHFENAVED